MSNPSSKWNELPKIVLDRIFSHCSIQDTSNLALTCKRFNKIISENRRLVERFLIEVLFNFDEKREWIETKQYSKLLINMMHAEIPRIIESTKNSLTELAFKHVKINGMVLKYILIKCSMLTKLSITNSIYTFTNECLAEPLPRLMLNEFICNSNKNVLNIMLQSQTKMYENTYEVLNDEELDALRLFFKSQKHLEDLRLYNFQNECKIFLNGSLNVVDFRLKQFRISGFAKFDVISFQEFLNNHRDSLTHMEIGQKLLTLSPVYNIYQVQVVNCIKDFVNLTSLCLRRICTKFCPLPFVRKLKMVKYCYDGNDTNWNEKFPNVNELILSKCESMQDIIKLSKLKTLNLENINRIEELEIPLNLKKLRLSYIDVNFDLRFDSQNGQLEVLWVDNCTEADWLVKFLNGLTKKLRTLRFYEIYLQGGRNFATVYDKNPNWIYKAAFTNYIDKPRNREGPQISNNRNF